MFFQGTAYESRRINEVDEGIFLSRCFANCLECPFCEDVCCSYGCQVDGAEMKRILKYASELGPILAIPSSQWFNADVQCDSDFSSGECGRTRVYANKCVFHNNKGRGCAIHLFAIEQGIDWHMLKPMVCSLFPITWEGERLFVSYFLDELPCSNQGMRVFEAQKGELKVYLGNDFVLRLEDIARSIGSVRLLTGAKPDGIITSRSCLALHE